MKKIIAASVILLVAIIVITVVGSFLVAMTISDVSDVQISTDRGDTWHNTEIQGVDGSEIRRVRITAFAATQDGAHAMFAGTARNGVLRGLQGGLLWRQITDKSGLLTNATPVTSMAIDSAGRLYVGIKTGDRGSIVRSNDGGMTVRETYTTPARGVLVTELATSPHDARVVWAGTSNGLVLRSDDFGERWQHMGEFGGSIRTIALHPRNPQILFLTTNRNGVFTSRNGGNTWEDIRGSLNAFRGSTDVFAVRFDPHRPSVVYMASMFGILRSQNAGETWQRVPVVIPETSLPVRDIRIDPVNSDILYVAAGDSLYQSLDAGASWRVRKLSPDRRIITHILPMHGTTAVIGGLGQ